MRPIVWVGACSVQAQPLKDFLNSGVASLIDSTLPKNLSGRLEPLIVVSEDFNELARASQIHPQALQLFICSSFTLLEMLQRSVRPLNRYYFLVDRQGLNDFQALIKTLEAKAPSQRRFGNLWGPIPSMHNSLEVLKRLTEERLFELKHFSFQEEDRRKNFRSLIHLARCLSMSRDIEEVVQYLWQDLRSVDGLKSLAFLIFNNSGYCHQITQKSGKFHFEELPSLSDGNKVFLDGLMRSLAHDGLVPLDGGAVAGLNFMLRQQFNYPFICSLNSASSENTFLLLIETDGTWQKTDVFEEYLDERLSFIHLTLEKHLLQEEIKSKANLWATTFDDLQDPLAIVSQNRTVIRSNRRFSVLDSNLCHSIWAGSATLCAQCPKIISNSTQFEIQIEQKIFQARLFPIYENGEKSPKSFIAHYVDSTTERILYSRLIQSEKMIAVGKLAGDLSEALSVPLKRIIEIANKILALPLLSDQVRQDTEEIRKAGFRSLRIIEDFENFSRGQIEKHLIMAETIVEKTIPLVKALLHGHRFYLQLAEPKHPIQASLSLLQQVLYNLLRNAHQAMTEHGEILITTETRLFEEIPGVQISVLDSGAGLSDEMKGKIFQPFVTSKSGTEGTGLGLNIVKQIVESHQGRVGYEPRPEGGSKFWIWIPTVADPRQ